MLIDALMKEAKKQSVTCVCLFTRIPEFFAKMGFEEVEKEELPDKALKDCHKCSRQNACDEIAMYVGNSTAACAGSRGSVRSRIMCPCRRCTRNSYGPTQSKGGLCGAPGTSLHSLQIWQQLLELRRAGAAQQLVHHHLG